MTVHFYIDRPKNKSSLIMITVNSDGNRIRMSTKKSILTKHWNSTKEVVSKAFSNASELNSFLSNIKSSIQQDYITAIAQKLKPDRNYIKNRLNQYISNKQVDNSTSIDFMNEYKKFIKSRTDDPRYKESTIKRYRVVYNHLQAYSKSRKVTLTFEDMNDVFYKNLLRYFYRTKNISDNTVGGLIKNLKVFLNYSVEKGVPVNSEFKNSFKVIKRETHAVALTFDEIKQIEEVIIESEKLKNVRDVFLLQNYTGLRYGDLIKLRKENFFIKEGEIKIQVEKVPMPLIIPIHNKLKKWLTKYPDFNFPFITNQRFNNYVKEVCKLAGIDNLVQTTKYFGVDRLDESKPKYELITSHTARRSFITLALKKGKLPEEIMLITGHTSRESFDKYVRASQEEALDSIRDVWK